MLTSSTLESAMVTRSHHFINWPQVSSFTFVFRNQSYRQRH